jgi:hypothetical protein
MRVEARYDAEAWALVFGPEGSQPFEAWGQPHHVFVVAALQDPARFAGLIGRQPPFAPALAYGFRRALLEVSGAQLPFMLEADDPQRALAGTVFLGLGDEELERVDAIELAGDHRRRIELEVTVGQRRVDAVSYVKRG